MTGESGAVRLAAVVALVGCVVYVGATALEFKDFYMDDAYIGFRCVENLISGRGLVFNPEERVEGVTNTGWLLFMTPLAAVIGTSAAGKILGGILLGICAFAVVWLSFAISRDFKTIGRRIVIAAIVPVAVMTSPALIYFSHSGMETAALCLLLLMAVGLSARRGRGAAAGTGVICGLAFAVRPECVIVYPLYMFFFMACRRKASQESDPVWNPCRTGVVAWLALVVAFTAARFAYFGSALPNTFYAKPSSTGFIFSRVYLFLDSGLTGLPQPLSGFLALPILILGVISLARYAPGHHAMVSAAAATGIIFSVYSASDWTAMPRYVAPYIPFAFLIIISGLYEAMNVAGRSMGFLVGFLAVFLVLRNFVDHAGFLGPEALARYPGFVLSAAPLARGAARMAADLPVGSVVACRRIGALAYVGGFQVFDFVIGLPHRDVVRARAGAGGRIFEDPRDPALEEIWKKRRPTYILEDRSKLKPIITSAGENFSGFTVHGTVYREKAAYPMGKYEEWVLMEAVTRP